MNRNGTRFAKTKTRARVTDADMSPFSHSPSGISRPPPSPELIRCSARRSTLERSSFKSHGRGWRSRTDRELPSARRRANNSLWVCRREHSPSRFDSRNEISSTDLHRFVTRGYLLHTPHCIIIYNKLITSSKLIQLVKRSSAFENCEKFSKSQNKFYFRVLSSDKV